MKRTQEKIKDIVEPQDFDEVGNVAADPARSLAAYRFTDATSDLLARWLDALADLPRGRGTARALAGARGVGKSHTLAVFGALAGQESLRQKVEDAHVATSARRLSGRRHTVVRVERGTRETLAEEMANAFSKAFGGSEVQWATSPSEMLAVAASRSLDATLVLVIDTGFERPVRVRRDDGPQLGEIARAAQGANAFVALALDDDISGADGPNVAIASTYQIDYLDHEHLFRIADTYILRKSDQGRAALHEIYTHLRAGVPDFNWSEPRFAALYPVHPLVADVSAAVRLYAPAFAFLPFASEAARRATSRPALSLVLLDEVFDRAERDLRKSAELKEAFEVFDDLSTRGVAQFPVMQRLEAKLVLKSLFILSLDGGGATAAGLCAALLVADEASRRNAVERVHDVLARFVETAPADALRLSTEPGGETRYCLQISAADKFKRALDRAVERLPPDDAAALEQLRAVARARFDDWPFAEVSEGGGGAAVNFSLAWRGSERRGRLGWQGPYEGQANEVAGQAREVAGEYELEVLVVAPVRGADAAAAAGGTHEGLEVGVGGAGGGAPLSVVWRAANLSEEELLTLRRLLALRTDGAVAADFGEAVRAASSITTAQAERIWARVYMNDGALHINGKRHAFTGRALAARSLADALAETFAPHFEELYPQHPQFAETLREADVERLTTHLFAGGGKPDEETQRLARTFAVPLALVEARGEQFVLAAADETQDAAWTKEALSLLGTPDAPTSAPLDAVRGALARAPFGLRPEAQNLLLAALIAQRRVDLLTASGERVSRRSLDQSISWESVTGVVRAPVSRMSAEELTAWARLLTSCPTLTPANTAGARAGVLKALAEWLEGWRELRLGEKFNALPDSALTTRAWKMNARVQKCFGRAAEAVKAVLAGGVTLEEGLERVSDAFDGSADAFAQVARQLDSLTLLVENAERRGRARAYLLTAEPTGVGEIETARRELLSIARDRESLFDAEQCERFNRLWPEFRARYTEHYVGVHDATVGASPARRELDAFLAGDRWREFEMLSRLRVVNRQHWDAAQSLLRRAETPRCDLPVRQLLSVQPSCACAFRLSRADGLARLPRELEELIELGLAAYGRTLALLGNPLRHALEALAARDDEKREVATRARILAHAFGQGTLPHRFSRMDVQLIERAASEMDSAPPVRVHPPTDGCGLLTRDELSARLTQWLDDLPADAALVELVAHGDGTE